MLDRVRCSSCGDEHDLSEMEPSYDRPDAFFGVPPEERERRTLFGGGEGRIRDDDDQDRRHFLRALLRMRVRGEARDCAWGIWVEIDAESWRRTTDRWDDPDQADEAPFAAQLANALRGYEGTLGLPGRVRLTGAESTPDFVLDAGLDHPLGREQREGVYPERVIEWLVAHLH
jgi:hypothetical protein